MATHQPTRPVLVVQSRGVRGRPEGRSKYRLTCAQCGSQFDTTNRKQVCCGGACRVAWRAVTRGSPPAACKRCGVQYRPKQSNRRTYCSRDCSYADLHDQRLARLAAREAARLRACDVCGREFKRAGAKRCSEECRAEAARRYSRQFCPYIAKPKKSVACAFCGVDFLSAHPHARFCSRSCSRRAEQRRHWLKVRAQVRERRASIKAGEDIDPLAVFADDGWCCWVCGLPVDRSAVFPAPLSAVIDHVVPFAKGGAHQRSNVRCAHNICNSHKSDLDVEAVRERCVSLVRAIL